MQQELRYILYTVGMKLVGECTRRSSFVITNCLFADDAALICFSREDMVIMVRVFEEVTAEYGLTLSIPKTKYQVTCCCYEPYS